jgi:plastin-3
MLAQDLVDDLKENFNGLDKDGNGFISISELQDALKVCGFDLPSYQIRDLVREYDSKIKDDKLDFEEFKELYAQIKSERDLGHGFKKMVSKRQNVDTLGGMTAASSEGTTHTVRKEEQVAFSNWINRNLADDPDCKKYIPLDPETKDLYNKCKDGIIFCKLINKSQPDTIDERTINKTNLSVYRVHENLTLALNSAQSIGCNIVNIGAEDLEAGKPHLVLGLLWQIIRIGLLSDINLHEHPGLAALLMEGESLDEFRKLSPEQILIRWVNYHLARSPCGRQVSNFSGDIKDSVAYIHLLHQIAPRDKGVTTIAENEPDLTERAERMLQESEKIGCRSFVAPNDVVTGNPKLNLAFVANLFNMYPALEKPEDFDIGEVREETREDKTYRNWMNSMGVSPYVNNLYSDLCDGIIIFQLYDIIRPGVVDWSKVITKFKKMSMLMEKIGNCNYAVKLGKDVKFSLVGIDGKDIYDGNETLTLALVWQLMRAYTLSILQKLASNDTGHPIVEKEIVAWANEKLKSCGKSSSITGFNDPTIGDARVVIDLVDAIKKGSVNYDMVKSGNTDKEKLDNAKYAISMGRKIGARIYALPEDIVEVKAKMVMTVFACLMIKDYQPQEHATS